MSGEGLDRVRKGSRESQLRVQIESGKGTERVRRGFRESVEGQERVRKLSKESQGTPRDCQ